MQENGYTIVCYLNLIYTTPTEDHAPTEDHGASEQ